MASSAAAQSFISRLHRLGDSGPANEHITSLFTSQILVGVYLLMSFEIDACQELMVQKLDVDAHPPSRDPDLVPMGSAESSSTGRSYAHFTDD
ncbi:hypothetical protein Ccrd_013967 [Cynara cardunculus var. scolymus]|uniref:Uncharacterized protein n=1 Tax=Cynara cardunculus var. scolymus TaxID=59895 RepID=A0A103YEK2_CYNCS|nr:hypothetical protein Ccrd_013967 [Cynara cardunculus var. scolymus]